MAGSAPSRLYPTQARRKAETDERRNARSMGQFNSLSVSCFTLFITRSMYSPQPDRARVAPREAARHRMKVSSTTRPRKDIMAEIVLQVEINLGGHHTPL